MDIIAAATGRDYQAARGYWKWLKAKLAKQKDYMVRTCTQIKMEAADGKLRRTDVMDAEGIIDLIKAIPGPKAQAAKLWLNGLAEKGEDAAQMIADTVANVKHRVGSLLYTITRTVIYDARIHGQQSGKSPVIQAPWKLAVSPPGHVAA